MLQEAFVSYDRHTGRPRGFGFVVFADPVIADKVVTQQHTIDRREVEAKRALPKEESPVSKDQQAAASGHRTKKVFVGGLAASVDEGAFREYFEAFGVVEDAVVMYDHENKRPRGFGFVTFTEEEAVDKLFARGTMQTIHDKQIEIKRAVPRDSMPPSPRALYRPPAQQQQQQYYEGRSPYGQRYTPRNDRYGGGPPHTPHSGYGAGGGGRGRGHGGRSPMPGGGGGGGGRGMYSPPVVVTGIPASMAGTPGGEAAMAGGGVMSPVGAMGGNGMMGVPPPSPVPVSPGGLPGTPQGLVGGFAMQNGIQGTGPGGQYTTVGSPPFALEAQQAAAAHNLADLQQQAALSSVTGALEQLQVQQQQQQQVQQQAQAQQAQQQQQNQQAPQQTTTIWS